MKFSGGYFMHSVAILYNKYGICSKEGDYLKKRERRRREELVNKTEISLLKQETWHLRPNSCLRRQHNFDTDALLRILQ